MKKISLYALAALALGCWACEDDVEKPTAPKTDIGDVFIDTRDGHEYHTVTIGDQTWMTENLAFRLDSGNWAGCFTWDEETSTTYGAPAPIDTAAVIAAIPDPNPKPELPYEEFLKLVNDAIEHGKLSDPLPESEYFTPGIVLQMMVLPYNPQNYEEFYNYVNMTLGYYPSLEELLLPQLEAMRTDEFTLFKIAVNAAIEDGTITSEPCPEQPKQNPAGIATQIWMYGPQTIDAYMGYVDMLAGRVPSLQETLVPVLNDIISNVSRKDPYKIFCEYVETAIAEGRFTEDYADMMIEASLPSATTVEGYLTSWKENMFDMMLPEATALLEKLGADAIEAAKPWAPSAEEKAAAIAAAVKETMDDYFNRLESVNGQYSKKYGLLYTLEGARKAAPKGWRVPTDEDWKKLETALGMSAGELDQLEAWRGSESGYLLKSEEVGMDIVFSGSRIYGDRGAQGNLLRYQNKDINVYYLTDTRIDMNDSTSYVIIREVSSLHDGIWRGTSHLTEAACSVRLIKDDNASSGKEEDTPVVPDPQPEGE